MKADYVIFVRDYCGTYHARSNGKQASCTAGPKEAAERVAGKLFGDRPFTMKTVTRFTFIATEEGSGELKTPALNRAGQETHGDRI